MNISSIHRTAKSFDANLSSKYNPSREHIPKSRNSEIVRNLKSVYSQSREKSELSQTIIVQNSRVGSSSGKKPNYLDCNLWYREIYVIRDGISTQKEILEGFKYKFFCFGNISRQTQIKELNHLFDICNRKWNSNKKFICLFSTDGKVLKSLAEINSKAKFVLIGQSFQFIGFIGLQISEKYIQDVIEKAFIIKDSESLIKSPRKKGLISQTVTEFQNKSFFMKFRQKSETNKLTKVKNTTEYIIRDRFKYMTHLKEKLGETSVKLDRSLPKINLKTLKQLMEKYEITESSIYKIYAQYKTLLIMSVAQHPNHNTKQGVNTDTLIQCLRKGDSKQDGLIEKLIQTIDSDGKGYLGWENFLKAMCVIQFGSLSQQIDMIFKMYDENLSGSLSYDEIKRLCQLKLKTTKEDNITSYLSECFAKIIFKLACVPINETISPQELKKLIQDKNDSSIIQMLCNFEL